jgi:serine/threonine protein kinase
MGVVYRARHVLLEKLVALKVLSADVAGRPDAAARFRREVKAAGRVEHPNVVRASDAGEAGGTLFLVMELLDGADLARLTGERGPWPVAEACAAARQAALGLQHAFEQGLVHRDVKPSNLFLTTAGVVKVLDLGLARLYAEEGGDGSLTGAGHLMGTADFMAPEQLLDSHSADIRADLYSLGCTLYHLLAGDPPFGDEAYPTTARKREAHLQEPAPDIRARRPDVPAGLAAVLRRLLAKRPGERYATPAEVAAALEPFAAGARLDRVPDGEWVTVVSPVDSGGSGRREPAPEKAPASRTGRRRWLTLAAVLLVAGGLGLGTWAWRGRRVPPAPPQLTVRAFRILRYQDMGDNYLLLNSSPDWGK